MWQLTDVVGWKNTARLVFNINCHLYWIINIFVCDFLYYGDKFYLYKSIRLISEILNNPQKQLLVLHLLSSLVVMSGGFTPLKFKITTGRLVAFILDDN